MRIQRFQATDMRGALRQVREAQGAQAVILSSARTDHGIEVVAAVDYDEALVRHAIGDRGVAEAPAPSAAASVDGVGDVDAAGDDADAGVDVASPATIARPDTPLPPAPPVIAAPRHLSSVMAEIEDPAVKEMRRELKHMRTLIEREVGRFAEERLRASPVRAAALDELTGYGCDAELARSIASQIPADADRGRARGLTLGLLAKSIAIPSPEPIEEGGIIALVGPTGVGKTTTLAKLAARFAAAYSPRDVALVTTDTVRVGAREQLQHYGRALGMPVIEIARDADLGEELERLADYRLVLVDTAGLSHRDKALALHFQWLKSARRMRSYLVLPATGQAEDLEEIVQRFRGADPEGVILSKLDETSRLGTALSVVIRHRLPLAYITDGQRVPEDLQVAEGHRIAPRLGELRRASRHSPTMEHKDAVA